MSFIRRVGRGHGVTRTKIVHNPGTDDEETHEADALIQGEAGFFEVDTPIFEGDLVEVPDPRRGPDGVERRLARKVKVNNMGSRDMHHVHVEWGAAPPPRV